MRTVGFLKIHDPGFQGSLELSKLLSSGGEQSVPRDRIINYLNSGFGFTAVPLMLHDDEGEPFFGLAYQTDGDWIWPNYFAYYLGKYPSMHVDRDFIDYLVAKDFSYTVPTQTEVSSVDRFFQEKIW